MLKELHLKFGPSPDQVPLKLTLEPSVTIFVGPNNSGKSQTLREMYDLLSKGSNYTKTIVEKIILPEMSESEALRYIENHTLTPNSGEAIHDGHVYFESQGNARSLINKSTLLHALTQPSQNSEIYAQYYLNRFVLNISGTGRLNLIDGQQQGNLKNPQNHFSKLLVDDTKRENLRNIIYSAIRRYFSIDISDGGHIGIRFSSERPPNERSVEDETLQYMSQATSAYDVSDGVKAFTGILIQLYAGNPEVIIIDEPEAFLHPSLASTLGKELANGAIKEGKQVFISTHSSQIIMGAIASGAKVNIVRLTYENEISTARLLDAESLTKLMNDPLLRSMGPISALFYEHVIVTEADADRAFYQEVNERLLQAGDSRGIPNVLFLNANNKQTIPKIIEPLRKLGVPAASIVDIDVLKVGGDEWTRHLKASQLPLSDHQPYGARRAATNTALKNTVNDKEEYKRKGGIALLKGEEFNAAKFLIEDLNSYGLFVVKNGEVESWLPGIAPSGKHTWLSEIFETMGSDPTNQMYLKPTQGDVWDFIGEIKEWFMNPRKRGISN
jgi:predicted ATPase